MGEMEMSVRETDQRWPDKPQAAGFLVALLIVALVIAVVVVLCLHYGAGMPPDPANGNQPGP